MLTKVFLKGKFTEQLNCHLQNKGEALPGRPRPAHLALPGLQGPPRVGSPALRCRGPWERVLLSGAHACPADLAPTYPEKALLSIGAPAVLWADLAPPQEAPGAGGWGVLRGPA